MSIAGELEAAVGVATGATWWRLALKALPYAAIAALAVLLVLSRQTLALERVEHKAAIAAIDADAAKKAAAALERWGNAADAFATRSAALKPLIIRSRDEVTTYAQTPAGAAPCRDADRVRRIDTLDAALIAPTPAAGGDEAVPADAAASPAGR